MPRISLIPLALCVLAAAFLGRVDAQVGGPTPPGTVLSEDRVVEIITADGNVAKTGVPTLFNFSLHDPWTSTDGKPTYLKWSELVDPRGDGDGKLPVFIASQDLQTLFHVTADVDFPRYNWDSTQDETTWQLEFTFPRAGNWGVMVHFEVLRGTSAKPPIVTYPNRNDTSRHTGYGRIVVQGDSGMTPVVASSEPTVTTRGVELNPLHPDTVPWGLTPSDLATSQPTSVPSSAISIDRFALSLSVSHGTAKLPVLPTNSCAFFFVNISVIQPGASATPIDSMSPIYETYGLVTVVHESLQWWKSTGTWIVGTNKAPAGLCPPLNSSIRYSESFAPTTMSQTSIINYGPTIGTPLQLPLPGKYAIFVQAARTPYQEKRRTLIVGQWVVEVKDGVPLDPDVLSYLNRDPSSGTGVGPYPTNNNSAYVPNPQGTTSSTASAPSNSGLIAGLVITTLVAVASLSALGVVLYKQKAAQGTLPSLGSKSTEEVGLESISRTAKVEDDGRPFVKMQDVEEGTGDF